MVSEIAASSLYVEAEMADFDITAVMEIRTIRTNDRTLPITSASFGANFILFNIFVLLVIPGNGIIQVYFCKNNKYTKHSTPLVIYIDKVRFFNTSIFKLFNNRT